MAWIDQLFKKMVEDGASDLHLSSTIRPMFRIDGDMAPIEGYDPIPPDQLKEYLKEIVHEANMKQFEDCGDTDFAYELELYLFFLQLPALLQPVRRLYACR